MLFSASRYQAMTKTDTSEENETKQNEQKKWWKAIYKISKINTIFIVDMLQNKFP